MILSLLQNLDRNRFEPRLLTLTGPGDLAAEAEKLGIPAVNLSSERGHLFKAGLFWLYEALQFQPHIIHSFLFHTNLLARLTRLLSPRTQVISGLRTVYTPEAYGRMYGILERLTHPLDRFYVANSDLGLKSAREIIGLAPGKLRVIRNGISSPHWDGPREEIRRQARREFGYGGEDLVVGVVAQLRPAKRHDILLRSAATLKEEFPRLRLLIVGNSEHRPALEALASKLGVRDIALFAGFRSDAARLLLGMDVFALPSEVEGQPVSIMEAMQAGLPVVASRVGGIPEVAEEGVTALLAEPGDEEAFTQALRAVLASEEARQEMGRQGRERIQAQFSAEAMTRQFEALYEKCVRGRE